MISRTENVCSEKKVEKHNEPRKKIIKIIKIKAKMQNGMCLCRKEKVRERKRKKNRKCRRYTGTPVHQWRSSSAESNARKGEERKR